MIYVPQLRFEPINARDGKNRHGLYYGRPDYHGQLVGTVELSNGQWKIKSFASNCQDVSPTYELACKSLLGLVKSEMKEVSR